jgi:ribosome-associated protein
MTGATIAIRGEMIRLGQFLKVADAVDQGSDVKALLATEAVTVNGDVEVRRGRQLHAGDVIAVGTATYRIAVSGQSSSGPPSGRYSSGS